MPSLSKALDYYLLCLAVMRVRGLGDNLLHACSYDAVCDMHKKLRRMIEANWLKKSDQILMEGLMLCGIA